MPCGAVERAWERNVIVEVAGRSVFRGIVSCLTAYSMSRENAFVGTITYKLGNELIHRTLEMSITTTG